MTSLKTLVIAGAVALAGGSVQAAGTYAATQYPFVMAHGAAGFDKIGPVDYWYGITTDLRNNGATVYTTSMSAMNSTDVRNEQFLNDFKQIMAISGAAKYNLMGHSHGAHSIRYVAAIMPDKVASVTTVDGVNAGTPVADVVAGLTNILGPAGTAVVAALVNGLGQIEAYLSGNPSLPQDSVAMLNSLTTPAMNAYNQQYPAGVPTTACGQGAAVVNGVRYYSWGGATVLTNPLDPLDLFVGATSVAFLGAPNDGLVGKCAQHLGTVIRDDYDMNHFDAVNQAIGIRGFFDPVPLYRQHANRLKLAGA